MQILNIRKKNEKKMKRRAANKLFFLFNIYRFVCVCHYFIDIRIYDEEEEEKRKRRRKPREYISSFSLSLHYSRSVKQYY
jgi:hypothetical protein